MGDLPENEVLQSSRQEEDDYLYSDQSRHQQTDSLQNYYSQNNNKSSPAACNHLAPNFDPLELSRRVLEESEMKSRSMRMNPQESSCSMHSQATMDQGAIYELHKGEDKAQYLYDGKNMIKIAPKKYSALIKTMGKRKVVEVMKKISHRMRSKSRAGEGNNNNSQNIMDSSEVSNLSEKFADFGC